MRSNMSFRYSPLYEPVSYYRFYFHYTHHPSPVHAVFRSTLKTYHSSSQIFPITDPTVAAGFPSISSA